jgi:hypothetical protein
VTVEVKPQVRGGPPIVSVFLYVVQSNFLHYRALAGKSLVTELKSKKKMTNFWQVLAL